MRLPPQLPGRWRGLRRAPTQHGPGLARFADNISCDNTHWPAALTIYSPRNAWPAEKRPANRTAPSLVSMRLHPHYRQADRAARRPAAAQRLALLHAQQADPAHDPRPRDFPLQYV